MGGCSLKRGIALVLAVMLCMVATACGGAGGGQAKPERTKYEKSQELQFAVPADGEPIAILDTSAGEIRVVLYPKIAPMAVENFIGLAQQGYYDGISFHRLVKDFVIQSGDATGTGTGGNTIWNGNAFSVEPSDRLHHYSGALAMAHPDGDPHGNTSQFYIVQTPKDSVSKEAAQSLQDAGLREAVTDAYRAVGGAPYLDNLYTVFGQVYKGMAVVDAIAATPCDESGVPKEAVLIRSVKISAYSAAEEEAALAADASAAQGKPDSASASPTDKEPQSDASASEPNSGSSTT